MFLIIENERGLAGTMMHEAAGGLEQLNPPESALSMLEKKKEFHILSQISGYFPKVEQYFMSKDLCYDFRKDKSSTKSHVHIS